MGSQRLGRNDESRRMLGHRGWYVMVSVVLVAGSCSPTLALATQPVAAGRLGFVESSASPPFHVLDGDTFEADLNQDGRVDLPDERVRLLYVDAPELKDSPKGTDPERGWAAQAFLRDWLMRGAVTLLVPRERGRDNFSRVLAIVRVGGIDVNLELVRAGHSYFDTRFGFPENYAEYALAEAAAFTARAGIWSEDDSRRRYLRRLEREGKTPAAKDNPFYLGDVTEHAGELERKIGRYVRVQARVRVVDGTNPDAVRVFLESSPGGQAVYALAFKPVSQRLNVTKWAPGSVYIVEGFVRARGGEPAILIHYASLLPRVAAGPESPDALPRPADPDKIDTRLAHLSIENRMLTGW
jgi:endonuclease YncB( thermonuclease family)